MNAPTPRSRKNSMMRNLGAFFGHIAHGVTSDPHAPRITSAPENTVPPTPELPPAPPPGTVRQQTLERQVETPEGTLILRRTIIDEVQRAEERP